MRPPEEQTRPDGLPVGTVVFLRSDIEGSMDLVRALGARYDDLNAEHGAIVRGAIERAHGRIVRTEGDAFFAVFTQTGPAARAAVEVQRGMQAHAWPVDHPFKVRIGLHAGAAHRAGDDYGGFEVNRAARISAMGWGGQIILSDAARGLMAADMEDGWSIRELGHVRLKGVLEPERIHQLEATGLPTDFPALRSRTADDDHLPKRSTTFVGREAELETLETLLEERRLLTLTGPGGTGKTTLALELARRHAADYDDGAWFVDLQAVRDTAAVKGEIAHGLGLFDGTVGPAADRLLAYVGERQLLVVIDNFEQVIDAADVVREVLDASDTSRVLVTSRVPLRLSAEQVYAVSPLGVTAEAGAETSEAVRLFIDRARRVRPDLQTEGVELDSIRSTCRLLDGLPLAIELCAARTSVLPVKVIHDRIKARLPLPDAGQRDLPERQRTIDATVAWSLDLLEPSLQLLFGRLGVFEGSFDLAQAEEICGPAEELGADVLSGLFRLAEHSLLYRLDDATGGIRFGMLETLRAFAASRLEASSECDDLRRRHALSYAALAEREGGQHFGEELAGPYDRLEPDAGNLASAAAFAIEAGDVATSFRLVGNLWRFWLQTGRLAEGRTLIEAALALPGAAAPTALRIKALDAAGGVVYWSADLPGAATIYEEQLALAQALGDPHGQALAWSNLLPVRYFHGDPKGGETALVAAQALFEKLGDASGLVLIEEYHAIIAFLDVVRDARTGQAPLTARAATALPAARPTIEDIADRYASAAEPRLRKVGQMAHAFVSLRSGDLATAARAVADAVRIDLVLREVTNAVTDLIEVPALLSSVGLAEPAAVVQGALDTALERLGIHPPVIDDHRGGAAALEALGPERYEAAARRGRAMSLDQLTDFIESLADDIDAGSGGEPVSP